MSIDINRRAFLATTGAAALAMAGANAQTPTPPAAANGKPVRIGFIGVGGRGTYLLNLILNIPDVQIPSICDINVGNLERAQDIVKNARGNTPEGYSKDPHDYQRMLTREDLDAVLIATPAEWHAEMAVDGMKAGKHVGSEVPGAHTMDECWALVKTKEKTGKRYMLLENYNYAWDRMLIANMMQQGVFGEPFYAECSYIHDCNGLRFNNDGTMTWRGKSMLTEYGNQYPTHAIGPVSKWMDINKTDRFVSLVSMMSKPAGLQRYVEEKFGPDSEQAKLKWNCAGMSVTLIKTEKDRLITVYYDATSPRPMSIFYLVQGTKGVFDSRNGISLDGISPAEEWEPCKQYAEKYEHPYWRTRGEEAKTTGHGGGDYFSLSDFAEMVRQDQEPFIDVYDSATWSAIMPLSQKSIRHGGSEVAFPDFTKHRA